MLPSCAFTLVKLHSHTITNHIQEFKLLIIKKAAKAAFFMIDNDLKV